jgi:hypothetical protein
LRLPRAGALSVLAALWAGCTGAQFNVHVRDAHRPKPIPDASVLLYDVIDDPCSNSASGGKLSNDAGDAWIEARWCGDARLVIAARGYSPVTRRFDSCETKSLIVDLEPSPPEPSGSTDPAAGAAREFLAALLARDQAAIERSLADPGSAGLYLTGGVASRGPPESTRFVGIQPGEAPAVQLDLAYENGCRESWVVRLVRRADAYLVTEVTRGSL